MNQNAGEFQRDNGGNGVEMPEFEKLITQSMEELRLKTMAHQKGWGFGKAATWSLEQSRGDLIFSFNEGVVATCPAQIIGCFDSAEGSWLWAWANPSIADALKRDSLRVREYGLQHHIDRLTSAEWAGTEEDAWVMAALACKLCGAQGVYRGPTGTAFVFMSFGKVVLSPRAH